MKHFCFPNVSQCFPNVPVHFIYISIRVETEQNPSISEKHMTEKLDILYRLYLSIETRLYFRCNFLALEIFQLTLWYICHTIKGGNEHVKYLKWFLLLK